MILGDTGIGREINLMEVYPRAKRCSPYTERALLITEADRERARQFGKDYFDGDRMHGYGGYCYHPRFWQATVRYIRDYYKLPEDASLLDVGCAKGFMLHDFKELMPCLTIAGIDISPYAVENAIETVKPLLCIGNARELPFTDKSFDLVTAINTIHNLPLEECKQALREIERVSRGHSFVYVDAYQTVEERERLEKWILTCKTYLHVDEWRKLFAEVEYTGDYYWFIAD